VTLTCLPVRLFVNGKNLFEINAFLRRTGVAKVEEMSAQFASWQ
jgi:hypothetical protein